MQGITSTSRTPRGLLGALAAVRLSRRAFRASVGMLAALALVGAACAPAAAPSPTATLTRPTPTPPAKPAVGAAPPSPAASPAAQGSPAAKPPAAPATGKPIKLGVLLSQSGPFVFEGSGGIEAIKLFIELNNNQLGGRPVEVVYEDTEGRPDQTLTKVKKLVEQDKVDLLVGPVGSNEALAIRDYVDQQKVPMFLSYSIAKDLTQDKASQYIFRTTGSVQLNAGGGWLAAKKLNYKRVISVATDYAAGRDAAAIFKQYFEGAGGQVVGEVFPPLGTTDVAPYITQIQSQLGSVDAVVLPQIVGETAIQFVKSYDQFGLKAQKPLFTLSVTVDDASTLPPEGDAAIGVKSFGEWALRLDNPENQKFVADFRAKYNKDPGQHHMSTYVLMQVMDAGLKAVSGDTADKPKLVQAFEKVQIATPAGAFKFDDKHQVIITVYLRTVEKQGNQLVNVINDKVENVSQAWQAPQ